MCLVFSFLGWCVGTFIFLGGAAEPLAGVSFTLLYFVFFGIWGITWIFLSEMIMRRSGAPWPHLFFIILVGLPYVVAFALKEDVPRYVSLPFVPMVILYLVKLSRLGGRVSEKRLLVQSAGLQQAHKPLASAYLLNGLKGGPMAATPLTAAFAPPLPA